MGDHSQSINTDQLMAIASIRSSGPKIGTQGPIMQLTYLPINTCELGQLAYDSNVRKKHFQSQRMERLQWLERAQSLWMFFADVDWICSHDVDIARGCARNECPIPTDLLSSRQQFAWIAQTLLLWFPLGPFNQCWPFGKLYCRIECGPMWSQVQYWRILFLSFSPFHAFFLVRQVWNGECRGWYEILHSVRDTRIHVWTSERLATAVGSSILRWLPVCTIRISIDNRVTCCQYGSTLFYFRSFLD